MLDNIFNNMNHTESDFDHLKPPLTQSDPPLSTLTQLAKFFMGQKYCDCQFYIDGSTIAAHKLILACHSPVFEKMFYGPNASLASTSDIFLSEDINFDEFKQTLQFIYTGKLVITDIVNAWSLFYIANKYLIDILAKYCLDYVKNNITLSSLILCYEYSDLYELSALKMQCYQDMLKCANALFSIDYHMKPATLRTLLEANMSQHCIISDLAVKTVNWGVEECRMRSMTSNSSNILNILNRESIFTNLVNSKLKLLCEICDKLMTECACVSNLMTNSHSYSVSTVQRYSQRTLFKIARRLDLSKNEYFSASVTVKSPIVLLGLAVETEMSTGSRNSCSQNEYEGAIGISVYEEYSGKPVTYTCNVTHDDFSYLSVQYVALRDVVFLEPDKSYELRVYYSSSFVDRTVESSVICNYMCRDLCGNDGRCQMSFYEEFGSVIRGARFYPL